MSITVCYIQLRLQQYLQLCFFDVSNFHCFRISGEQHCDSRELRNDLGCDCVRRPKLSSTWVSALWGIRWLRAYQTDSNVCKHSANISLSSEFLASHQLPGNRVGTTVWPDRVISKASRSQNVREVISKDLQDVLIQFIMSHSLRYGWQQCWFKWGDTKII